MDGAPGRSRSPPRSGGWRGITGSAPRGAPSTIRPTSIWCMPSTASACAPMRRCICAREPIGGGSASGAGSGGRGSTATAGTRAEVPLGEETRGLSAAGDAGRRDPARAETGEPVWTYTRRMQAGGRLAGGDVTFHVAQVSARYGTGPCCTDHPRGFLSHAAGPIATERPGLVAATRSARGAVRRSARRSDRPRAGATGISSPQPSQYPNSPSSIRPSACASRLRSPSRRTCRPWPWPATGVRPSGSVDRPIAGRASRRPGLASERSVRCRAPSIRREMSSRNRAFCALIHVRDRSPHRLCVSVPDPIC